MGFWWWPLGHGARTALPGAGSVLPVVGLAAALLALTGLDFPALAELSSPHYIEVFGE